MRSTKLLVFFSSSMLIPVHGRLQEWASFCGSVTQYFIDNAKKPMRLAASEKLQ